MAELHCPSCGLDKKVPDKYAGETVRCPRCGDPVELPQAEWRSSADPALDMDPAQDQEQAVSTQDSYVGEPTDNLTPDPDTPDPDTPDQDAPNPVNPGQDARPAPIYMPERKGPEDGRSINLDATSEEPKPEPAEPETAYFNCPACGHMRPVPGSLLGRQARCPVCKAAGTVDAAPAHEPELPSEDDVDLDDLAQEEDAERVSAAEAQETVLADDGKGPGASLLQGGLLQNLIGGLGSGLVTVFFCAALAVLLFPQGLETGYFSHIFGALLGASALAGLVFAARSRLGFAMAGPESVATAVLFVLVGGLYADMVDKVPDQAVYATIWMAVVLAALVAALFALVLSLARGGSWVRFLPVQIVGGVLAGLGLLLIKAAFLFLTGRALTLGGMLDGFALSEITQAVNSGSYWTWVPAFALGWVLFIVFQRKKHAGAMAAVLVLVCIAAWAMRQYAPQAMADKLWTGPALAYEFQPKAFLALYSGDFLGAVQWPLLVQRETLLAALGVLLLVTFLYKNLLLEEGLGQDLDLDRELQALGLANLVSGLAAGPPVSLSHGRSLGARQVGAAGRFSGILAALVAGAGLVYAGQVLRFVPPLVPAGLLVYFGLCLLKGWLLNTRTELTRKDDYYLLLLTFLVTALLGVVVGVGLGLVLAMLVTVARYSKAGAIKHVLSGANHRSNVDRAPRQLRVLKDEGDRIFIIRLQGFVFLGTFHAIRSQVMRRLRDTERAELEYLIVDFGFATGLGSSVAHGFARLLSLGRENGLTVICTSVPFEVEEALEKAGLVQATADHTLMLFVNLDYAMEWCENHILEAEGLMADEEQPLAELLAPLFQDATQIPVLVRTLQQVKLKRKQYAFRQGDDSDAMFFVETGTLTVELNLPGGRTMRLKKLRPGAVFGEMGLYTTAPRSASVVADEASVVYRLSKVRLEHIRTRMPALYSAINRYLVTLMAERVMDANAMVRDLSR